jgi:hypothetical protein
MVLGAAFWLAVTLTFYTYAGYPAWIYLRSCLYLVQGQRRLFGTGHAKRMARASREDERF